MDDKTMAFFEGHKRQVKAQEAFVDEKAEQLALWDSTEGLVSNKTILEDELLQEMGRSQSLEESDWDILNSLSEARLSAFTTMHGRVETPNMSEQYAVVDEASMKAYIKSGTARAIYLDRLLDQEDDFSWRRDESGKEWHDTSKVSARELHEEMLELIATCMLRGVEAPQELTRKFEKLNQEVRVLGHVALDSQLPKL